MAKITVECGPAGPYYHFEQNIINRQREDRSDWIYILPVNRAVRLFNRKLIDAHPHGAILEPAVFTFDSLLKNLYGYLPNALRIVPAQSMPFLIEETLRLQSAKFRFFPHEAAMQGGLVRKISALISELHRFGYNAAAFSSGSIAEQKIPPDKHADLLCIMQQLESLFEGNYIDAGSAVHAAATQVTPALFKRMWPDVDTVFINGYGVFTPAMFAFIKNISTHIRVHIKLDYVTENPTPFNSINQPLKQFKKMGAEIVDLPVKSVLAGCLFNRKKNNDHKSDDEKISLISSPDRNSEIEHIVLKIRELHIGKKIPLHKIALTFPNLESYAAGLRQGFEKYGIPLNLSTGFPLQRAPLIETIIGLLETHIQNFHYERVFNLFQSPFFYGKRPAIGDLHKGVITLRLRHLTPGWEKQLPIDNPMLPIQIEALNTFLQPLYNFGRNERSSDSFHHDLIKLLKDSGILKWYQTESQHNERQKEREFRAYNAFMKMLDPFFWSLKLLYKDTLISLPDFLKRLKAAIAQVSFNLTEWPRSGVQVMPRLEIQAVEYDILFLGGLIDGQLPRSAAKDIFLEDSIRDELGLIATEELLDQDRFLFYMLLDAPARHVYLCHPRHDAGKTLVPSTFIDELKNCILLKQEEPSKEPPNAALLWDKFGQALRARDVQSAEIIFTDLYHIPSQDSNSLQEILKRIKIISNRAEIAHKPDTFEGEMSGSPLIINRLQEEYNGHLWSVSQLEEYAFCPMQFFFKRWLKLSEWPEFETDISPLDRGNAIHLTLFRFFNYLKTHDALSKPAEHISKLQDLARKEFDRLPFSGFFWELEKERFLGNESEKGLLALFAESEQEQINSCRFDPAHFEFSFGGQANNAVDHASTGQPLILKKGGLSLKMAGKIDRVDMDGQNRALVFDYKTGGVPGASDYLRESIQGYRFQLAIYLLAVKKFFPQADPVYAGLYQLKDDENFGRRAMMARQEFSGILASGKSRALLPNKYIVDRQGEQVTLEQLLEISGSAVFSRYEQLLSGNFEHSSLPESPRCSSYCDFRRMCQKHVYKQKALLREDF